MTQRMRRYCLFLASTTTLVVVWTIVLPWLGRQTAVRTMILRNEALGIDPTAMFYTELENMRVKDGILQRVDRP